MEIKNYVEYLGLENGIRVIIQECYPKRFPLHCHKCVEIIASPENAEYKQSALIRVNQSLFPLYPGDILFIWPGELHEVIDTDGHTPMAVQYNSYLIHEVDEFAPYINSFRSFQYISKKELPELADALTLPLKKMAEIQRTKEHLHETKCTICLLEMFIDFAEYLRKHNIGTMNRPRIVKTMDKINDACGYMIANCQQELTLEAVANHVGFNSGYFSRMFKKVTGYNFIEYLTLQRVNAAQLLLIDSDMNITEVAYAAGFKSISSFNRVFKQLQGCSPRDYRKYYYSSNS